MMLLYVYSSRNSIQRVKRKVFKNEMANGCYVFQSMSQVPLGIDTRYCKIDEWNAVLYCVMSRSSLVFGVWNLEYSIRCHRAIAIAHRSSTSATNTSLRMTSAGLLVTTSDFIRNDVN